MKFHSRSIILVALLGVVNTKPSQATQQPASVESWQKAVMLEDYLENSEPSTGQRMSWGKQFNPDECTLSEEQKGEIQKYQSVVDQIMEASMDGDFKGKTYQDLAYFVDKFGPRVSGSEALEEAITWLGEQMKNSGLGNVHDEEATVPKWLR